MRLSIGSVRQTGRGTTDSAVVRAQRSMARAIMFFRIGGLAELLLASSLDMTRYSHPALTGALIVAVFAESVLFIGVCQRSGTVTAGWTTADMLFCTVALVVCAVLTAPRDYHTWANFMYPLSLLTALGAGVGYRSLPVATAMTTVLTAANVASAVLVHGDPVWNAVPDGMTYYANMVVSWAVTRQLLASGREADLSRADAVDQAGKLAQERERARHARVLHDRVLQTLETLAQGSWVSDADFRTHIATEATWLRAFVEGDDTTENSDLLAGLQRLVQRNARIGLRVELNSTQLRDAQPLRAALRPELVDAVVDATQEALTNAAKHSGVDTVVVRAGATATALTVSVLDQGCGFDPEHVERGTGIERSIRSRIAEVDGAVRIDSAAGAGTYVEITVPLLDGVVFSADMTPRPASGEAGPRRGGPPVEHRPSAEQHGARWASTTDVAQPPERERRP